MRTTEKQKDRLTETRTTIAVVLSMVGIGSAVVPVYTLGANSPDLTGAGMFAIAAALSFGFLLQAVSVQKK